MTSMHEVSNKPPGDFFLAVVSMEPFSVVGIIDDPVGIQLSEVRLQYPLEFWLPPKGVDHNKDVNIGFIVPELGIPDEMIIDAGSVDIHTGGSTFGLLYFGALKNLIQGPATAFKPKLINRPLPGGTQNGARERHQSL